MCARSHNYSPECFNIVCMEYLKSVRFERTKCILMAFVWLFLFMPSLLLFRLLLHATISSSPLQLIINRRGLHCFFLSLSLIPFHFSACLAFNAYVSTITISYLIMTTSSDGGRERKNGHNHKFVFLHIGHNVKPNAHLMCTKTHADYNIVSSSIHQRNWWTTKEERANQRMGTSENEYNVY